MIHWGRADNGEHLCTYTRFEKNLKMQQTYQTQSPPPSRAPHGVVSDAVSWHAISNGRSMHYRVASQLPHFYALLLRQILTNF